MEKIFQQLSDYLPTNFSSMNDIFRLVYLNILPALKTGNIEENH